MLLKTPDIYNKYLQMLKRKRIVKLSEKVLQEIIDADGGFIKGHNVEFPGASLVKADTPMHKKTGHVPTSKQFSNATSQPGDYYLRLRGYSTSGAIREFYLVEDDISEDVYKRSEDTDIISNGQIPNIESLYNVFDATELAEKTKEFAQSLSGFSGTDNYPELLGITLKYILSKVNPSQLTNQQKRELYSLFNG